MKRTKFRCVYRLKSGPRRGQMCKEPVTGISLYNSEFSEYCPVHGLKMMSRKYEKLLSRRKS